MFKNPSLNNVFSKHFDGFLILSKHSEIEIILRELANLLSKNYLILYISNTDTSGLDDNIYYLNIFNESALKRIKYLKKLDFIFIENISFLTKINFPKGVKIIASGFLKDDLIHFKKLKLRMLQFVINNNFFKIFNNKCSFQYNFKPENKSIFQINHIDFDIDKECEFYLNCLAQGFCFYDFRTSRKEEILNAFANGNIMINDEFLIKNISKKSFILNNYKINCDFIPKNFTRLNIKK